MTKKIIYIFSLILLVSCDAGLSPEMASIKPGFSGTVTFIGQWDSQVKRTHVVLFENPLRSKKDFNILNLKYVSDSIATGTTAYVYNTNNKKSLISNIKAGDYSYLAVAQSKTEKLSLNREDWFIVGLYSILLYNSIQPKILTIPKATFVDSVDIICDFNNPPPQPPGDSVQTAIINKMLGKLKTKISK